EARAVAGVPVSGVEPPLKQLACENRSLADGGDVADEHLAEAAGQGRRKIAHLVAVGEDDVIGRVGGDKLLQRGGESVGGVRRQQRVLDADDARESLRGGFGGERGRLRTHHYCRNGGLAAQAARGYRCFPTEPGNMAVAILKDCQNAAHSTRASNLSFSTSAAAISCGVPESICVDFCFCGKAICSSVTTGGSSTPRSAALRVRTSLVLARLMPIRVA